MAEAFELRNEVADGAAADALLDAAFGIDRRLKASYRLREGNRPLTEGALAAYAGARLAGLISFWPVVIAPLGRPALLLGPIAVHPDFQGAGLGSRLMRAGLEAVGAAGHDLVFLVGDEPFYGRFGFRPVREGRIELPGPFDPERLLYRELTPGALGEAAGLLIAAHRFGAPDA
ncbi:MAG TPA: N-acetyltransferase [Thermopetrobacter sp.]|nr:N-acetyltransferase [Thermopetrobacter sp.]